MESLKEMIERLLEMVRDQAGEVPMELLTGLAEALRIARRNGDVEVLEAFVQLYDHYEHLINDRYASGWLEHMESDVRAALKQRKLDLELDSPEHRCLQRLDRAGGLLSDCLPLFPPSDPDGSFSRDVDRLVEHGLAFRSRRLAFAIPTDAGYELLRKFGLPSDA